MAEGTVTLPDYVAQLTQRLQCGFPGGQVSHEQVRGDRYRFVVIWDGFEGIGHPERQRRVWEIADSIVAKSDIMKVAMIITLAPSEVPTEP
jgi:hypothetical protein